MALKNKKSSPIIMQEILKKYNIKANKSLGQNFLIDENIVSSISLLTSISGENIIEVGPGFGVLSEKILSQKPQSLTLVELDEKMIAVLKKRIENKELNISQTQFDIIHQDVLKYDVNKTDYKVIANIPYYITSPILHHFLYNQKNPPKEMVILMQKEVGEKILSKKSGVLSLFLQKKCDISSQIIVPKGAFFPAPKVDSIVLSFSLHEKYKEIDDEGFLNFIKKAFSHPRKKMINNLQNFGYGSESIGNYLQANNFSQNTRPEELSIEDFINFYTFIHC